MKKIQVDLESHDHGFEEFEDKREFNDKTPSKSSKSKTSSIRSGNWDWSSPTTSPRSQVADQVLKLGLIFIYYKSEFSCCRSGPEIGTDLHLLQVRGRRPIGPGNSDKANSQKRLLGFPSYMKLISIYIHIYYKYTYKISILKISW